ncbi:metalloprotease [Lithospermum erythrorhizon]|uniref:Metalloprotease n=1 Tax=Lithospermum erythrorhizon TaxID=34254 RepID=A0AAV3Q8H0_LITER
MTSETTSYGGIINIESLARRIHVDNRFSLRIYYRIADNILKQADIFRAEKNILDLYIMLLRFSSLVSETIPCHRDYKASLQSNKVYLKKRLLSALAELENLKPAVQVKLEELNRSRMFQLNNWGTHHLNQPRKQLSNSYGVREASFHVTPSSTHNGPMTQQISIAKPAKQFRPVSLYCPKEETLSRHSILGPNGLHGQWQPPSYDRRVQYPSDLNLAPVDIPHVISPQQPIGKGSLINKDNRPEQESSSEQESLDSTAAIDLNSQTQKPQFDEPGSLISFDAPEIPLQTVITRQPSPPPVLAEVQDLIPTTSSLVTESECMLENQVPDGLCSEAPLELHISTNLMDSFMRLAKSNTNSNLETCGVLAGSLKNRKFYVTALIIPKQESTSDSCQTTNEEEIFEVQDQRSLFPLGWIHTHPTQSCFMSSIDVHTQYSYQVMLPEAIAIVMAPKDSSRTHGIFRLTTPGGMTVIRHCPHRGFHPHDPPPDGSPIYKQCTDVYMDSKLKYNVIDLR